MKQAGYVAGPEKSGAPNPAVPVTDPSQPVTVCLVGGKQIIRQGIALLLERNGVAVAGSVGEDELAEILADQEGAPPRVIVLILMSAGPFRAFYRLRDLLKGLSRAHPLVILTDKTSRSLVYAALRIGAKAYVDLDASCQELVKGITMAARGKVYLTPEAAELLAKDVSKSGQVALTGGPPKVELSPRELEIVQLLCEGLISREIAQQLHISAKTVENHRYHIYRKCEVDNVAGLIRHAIQHHLVSI